MSLRGRTLAVAIRTSPLRSCLRRLPFFLRRKKGRKERRQNQGFEILSAAEVPSASVLPTPRVGMCKFCALLSHRLCVPIRDALCACAALAGREKTSASTVRRDVGIAPYGYFEGWCRRAGVGIGPYRKRRLQYPYHPPFKPEKRGGSHEPTHYPPRKQNDHCAQ